MTFMKHTPISVLQLIAHFSSKPFSTARKESLENISQSELDALAKAANKFFNEGRFKEAAYLIGLVIQFDCLNPSHWKCAAQIHRALNDSQGALSCLQILAILQEGDDTHVLNEYRCLIKTGMKERGGTLLKQAHAARRTSSAISQTGHGDIKKLEMSHDG